MVVPDPMRRVADPYHICTYWEQDFTCKPADPDPICIVADPDPKIIKMFYKYFFLQISTKYK